MEKKIIEVVWHWAKMIVLCVVVMTIVRAFIFVPLQVTGSSMSPTLKEKDFIIMENFSSIERFDVVVFHASDGNTYIKRVIGLPGETVTYEKDTLFINNKKVKEPFLTSSKRSKDGYAFTTDFNSAELIGTKKIPDNQYFVLGDNRRLSKDSRSFGSISTNSIIGKAQLVYYPLTHMKMIKK